MLFEQHTHKQFTPKQFGGALTVALGAVALVAALSVATYNLIGGSVRTAATLTLVDRAKDEMRNHLSQIVRNATNSDADSVVELAIWDSTTQSSSGDNYFSLIKGGGLPISITTSRTDPWGSPYGYCTWDHGTINTSTDRSEGASAGYETLLDSIIVSAGPDRKFNTGCDNAGIVNVLTSGSTTDDIILRHIYGEAVGSGGGGADEVWNAGTDGLEIVTPGLNVGIGKAADSSYDFDVLGNSRIAGNLSIDTGTLTSGTVDINGGTIDNIPIGITAPAAGTFTNLTANGTGEIDGIAIGYNVPAIGTFTNLTAEHTIQTQAGTIVQLNGTLTITDNAFFLSRVNNVAVGTVTPSTGRFSTLAYTGTLIPPNTTLVGNLNADLLDGQDTTYYRSASNLNAGILLAGRMTGFTGDMTTVAGNVATSVVSLQGRNLNSTAPNSNEVLGWNGSAWAPMSIALGSGSATVVGFTGVNFLGTDTNITSGNCSTNQIPKYTGSYWSCNVDSAGVQGLPIDAETTSTSSVIGAFATINSGANFLGHMATDNTLLGRNSGNRYFTASPTGSYNTFLGAYTGQNITSGNDNTAVGANAGAALTSGSSNVFVGSSAGAATQTGSSNVFVGHLAGAANTASENIFIGQAAGRFATTGLRNIFIGSYAGVDAVTTGNENIVIGSETTRGTTSLAAGRMLTSGSSNVFIGATAGGNVTTASSNVFIGTGAGRNNTADSNIFIGSGAGNANTSGNANIFVGASTGITNLAVGGSNTTGSNNIFFGTNNNNYTNGASGRLNTTGSDNLYLSAGTTAPNNNGSGNLVFGSAMPQATNGNNNFYYGAYANNGTNGTGNHNISISPSTNPCCTALNNSGQYNIGLGNNMYIGALTTGSYNIFLGFSASAYSNTTTGNSNIKIGAYANGGTGAASRNMVIQASGCCGAGGNGGDNVFIGASANANSNVASNFNVGLGSSVGPGGATVAEKNVFIGALAGRAVTSSNNVLVGQTVGYTIFNTTSGGGHTAFGRGSAASISTGTNNICVGSSACTGMTTGSNNVFIGNSVTGAAVSTSNTIRIRRTVATAGDVITGTMNSGNLSVQGAAWTYLSDKRLKKDVHSVDGKQALAGLLKLRAMTFKWNGISNKDTKSINYGVIAQDVLKIFPHLVTKFKVKGKEYLQVAYDYFTPLLIEAMKEQELQFNAQHKLIMQRKMILQQQADRLSVLQDKIQRLSKQAN